MSLRMPVEIERALRETWQTLGPGALLGLREICVKPETVAGEERAEIARELSQRMKAPVSLLTFIEWRRLLERCGFVVQWSVNRNIRRGLPKRLAEHLSAVGFLCVRADDPLPPATQALRVLG